MTDWVYPVNEDSPHWALPSSVADYFRTTRRDNWYLATGYRQVAVGDRIWAYASQPYQRILGVGVVTYGPDPVLEDGHVLHCVDIQWDLPTNRRLVEAGGLDVLDRHPITVRQVHPAEQRRLDARLRGDGITAPELPRGRVKRIAEITARQGQGPFRERLTIAYQGMCAISGCSTPEALEAAHIEDYDGPATNQPGNGLLLRADLHSLFDGGLLWIDGNYKARVAAQVTDPGYRQFEGQKIRLPKQVSDRPSKQALKRHRQQHGED